jgi:hypothetical protein
VELLRTRRLLLRGWVEGDAPAFLDIYSRDEVTQRVALRLGMVDDGVTGRWFGITTRQFRKALATDQHLRFPHGGSVPDGRRN